MAAGKRDAWEAHVDKRLEELEEWKATHLTECHPQILQHQGKMEGRWAVIAGFCTGVGLALGYVAAEIVHRWLGG